MWATFHECLQGCFCNDGTTAANVAFNNKKKLCKKFHISSSKVQRMQCDVKLKAGGDKSREAGYFYSELCL